MSETSGQPGPDDIAIVGLAGRFPGAGGVGELWTNLRAGRLGLTRFTDDELRAAGVPEDVLADPAYVKAAPVLEDIDRFDAAFFGMGPKEAQILDPQQRLFLEQAWAALEDAGCDPTRFDGAIGVFGGTAWSSYLTSNLVPAGTVAALGELAVGLANDKDSLTLRVAHTFGLSGPTYTVQSFCSTSLVAVCAAASSLAAFESDLALAGGVFVGVPHHVGYTYQPGGIAPPDGECRVFDAAGLGSPLGGGVGVVALRRLGDALADGDRVYAVLRGWAVNNDAGRKVGFTAPGVRGQAAVVAEALAAAGLEPGDIDYVETHGTGTALGDAAELAGLQQVFAGTSVRIGSVKPNLGHLDRAAGVTNLIKAALALHHGEIPPTRAPDEPSAQLSAGEADLEIVTELTGWPREHRPRRAGVSAFGIGGTNAHVVLEEAPAPVPRADPARPEVLVWSARTARAADDATAALAAHLAALPADTPLADTAYTLQTGRKVFGHRRTLTAATAGEAAAALADGGALGRADERAGRPVAFLLTGAGEQYPGLAADLYATEPVFRAELDRCRAVLTEVMGEDPLTGFLGQRASAPGLVALLGRASADADPSADTAVLHPALFAVEYSLAAVVRSWGVEPAAVAGYSLGEYVAACVAGVLSLEDALRLVAHRSALVSALPGGAMAAVPLPEDEVRARLPEGIDVAAVNGAAVTVVAGPADAVEEFAARLAEDSVPCRPLATSHAFHSRMLEPVRAPLTAWIAANVTLRPPVVPYLSMVTGRAVTAEQATDPGYWAEHLCAPVRFDDTLATLFADPDVAVLEIGPGQSLSALARGHRDCPPPRWPLLVATMPAAADPRPGGAVLAEALGRLWLAGVSPDWAGVRAGRPAAKTTLPGYPFQRERYWIDPPGAVRPPAAVESTADSPATEVLAPVWTAENTVGFEPPARCVLLAGTADALAEAVAEQLAAEGVEVLDTVPSGPDPLLVLDLRPLDADGDGRGDVRHLAGELADWAADATRTTWVVVVTRGAAAVAETDRPSPAAAAVAALPVVANQEYLNLDCRAVDLDPAADLALDTAAVAGEAVVAGGAPLVAYRAGHRHVRGFAAAEPGSEPGVRAGGAYLVTGGLGDVGLLLAGHLAAAGAARVVLTTRGRAAEDLAGLGCEVRLARADAADMDAMRAVLAEHGPFDGVFHAAADTAPETFAPLRDLTAPRLDRAFGAKVGGALVLERLLAESADPPAFCFLFSSVSALLGGVTFGGYAAANAAITAVAARNRGGRTRWVAASWDTWSVTLSRLGGGFGATMAAHAMDAADGLAALDRVLASGLADSVVAAGGLDDRLPGRAIAAPPAPTGDRFPRPDLPQPYRPPATATEKVLAELWSEVLGVAGVGTRDNFFDLGGTSLVGLQMLALAKQRLGVSVPTVALFEGPTVHAFAAILDQHGGTPTVAQPVAQPGARALAEPVSPRPSADADADADADDRRIAVIGMAGRFPGASDVDAFWKNLREGVESISFFTPEELAEAGVDAATAADPNYVPARPVLDDVAGFDAAFFGMSPRTAALTDPQQRLFLEVCWEALEQAGYVDPDGRGRVGVYAGSNISTYLLRMSEHLLGPDSEVSHYEVVMGNDKDALTTTASYLFDLHGPSVAVQTFCSTSLVATHLAVQALRSGECELAIAGGVSVRVPDRIGHIYGPGGMESPDGHVRTFDAAAKGSMFGDGAAVVVLKRLSDALRDGDHIWSVIRGTAMNNDGSMKVGYTAPSVTGQARVVADALADAGVGGADISYVEAHGTATELGDPIEVAALTRAFGAVPETQYCPIGSVKTNVGHLDRAAGVSGLIKTSLALTEGVIPPTLHYTSPNPDIDFAASPFYVATGLTPWTTRDGRPRIAGINSLGMGGTNVHTVVEQAPERQTPEPVDPESARRYQVLPLSARAAAAAEQARARLGAHLAAHQETALADVAYTLQTGRKVFEHRRVLVAGSTAEAAAALTAEPAAAVLGRTDAVLGRGVAMLFAGVGEQYPGMVAELYRREPVFRDALDRCLLRLGELSCGLSGELALADLLTGARAAGPGLAALLGRAVESDPRAAELERTEVVQPAVFAVEYALATTLSAWGVRPAMMLGYSLGEYVAACLAGVLSLDDALRLVAYRAKLIACLPGGAMLAVSLPAEDLARYDLDARGIDVAAYNGPQVSVLAGPADAVAELAAVLTSEGVASRELRTTHAFHSRMLRPAAEPLTEWVRANITLNPPQATYLSNVTGAVATAELVCDPGYWARHMCEPVRFAEAVAALLADPELAMLEVGPGQSLGALVRGHEDCARERWPLVLGALPAAGDPQPDDAALTAALARLWLTGVDIDWRAFHGRDGAPHPGLPGRIPLPTYPFQRQRYWMDPPRRHSTAALPASVPAATDLFEAIASLPKLPEDQWLYLPAWRQVPTPEPASAQPSSWLLFARDGLPDEVAARLRATGAAVDVVRPGSGFARADGGDYTAAPGSVDDLVALLRDLRSRGRAPQRVVHLWSIGAAPGQETLSLGLHTLVALARAAGEEGLGDWALDTVVAGTQEVMPGDVVNPDAATLLGPTMVLGLEYPALEARMVDIGADTGAERIVTELRGPVGASTAAGTLVALRGSRRWTPAYERMAPPPAPDRALIRDGGVYLVTGGLGGIALGLAEELAASTPVKLVLQARRGLPPEADWPAVLAGPEDDTRRRVAAVSRLRALGAEVAVVVGDIADEAAARLAVDTAIERFGALHGVLHAAGVPGIGLVQFKQPSDVDKVLAPKVAGTDALLAALGHGGDSPIDLDFLVLFSSITAATGGGPGQIDYCAANAYVDAVAHRLAADGTRVLSVNWGEWTWNAWEEGLRGYDTALQDFFRQNRARTGIDFADGWRSLLRALASGEPRIVVSPLDFPSMVAGSALFNLDAVLAPPAPAGGGDRHPRPDLMTPYQEPAGEVEAAIARIWRDALRVERVGVLDNFFELGGNSLLGVGIVAAIRREFDIDGLPPHILYEAPTVAALGVSVDLRRSGTPEQDAGRGSGVRAQLRRSGLDASAARRRGR